MTAAPRPVEARPRPSRAYPADPGRRLVLATARKDITEMERAINRMGIAAARKVLADQRADPRVVAAVLAACPLLEQSWYMLPSVVAWMSRQATTRGGAAAEVKQRRARAKHGASPLAAARAARAITEKLGRYQLLRYEESSDTLRPAADALLRAAANPRLPVDARAEALLALAQARRVVALKDGRLMRFLSDPEAPIRQAAVELFAGQLSAPALASLAQRVASDVPEVARAAATVLCAQLPRDRKRRAIFLSTLRNTGAEAKLPQLAADPKARVDELVELARCLRASPSRKARRVLSKLLRKRAVRRALARTR